MAPKEPSQKRQRGRPPGASKTAIPRSTITSKWSPLTAPSIAAIDAILTDAARPVLHRLRDRDQRRAQAQTILRLFTARLRGKLVKGMPFPPATTTTTSSSSPSSAPPSKPRTTRASSSSSKRQQQQHEPRDGGREAELDFEKTVDAIAALERVLDPLLHSAALLRAERDREQRALKRDYALLRRLEANARAQARSWREGRGREHDLQDEEELLALSQQIGSHMESMRSNLAQIEGVLPAIAKSRAALQGVLCELLSPEQYEQVLLG
ncbi:ed9861df-e52d-4c43-86db-f7506a82d843 [Thermothielavioides terrestris]|uniref:Ed9861df-e52d-4c43-86db-f7506a82d843 n=1 Tax=Thermothielavioides terrestris TaxID=2587410 RepID=A0A3S4AZM3_9PEZI|nr:ed9861df-e52d-4c43-86db-f7506a82d843 [Thermothielavioides terrestris]